MIITTNYNFININTNILYNTSKNINDILNSNKVICKKKVFLNSFNISVDRGNSMS